MCMEVACSARTDPPHYHPYEILHGLLETLEWSVPEKSLARRRSECLQRADIATITYRLSRKATSHMETGT